MRTTLDLPDELLRLAKARAALRGMKLKELITEALENALYYRGASETPRASDRDADAGVLVIDEKCVLPLIRGAGGPALKKLTGAKATELLEREDVERETGSRRR